MKWTSEAEAAVKNVPFFVRKKVRARVEQEAAAAGKDRVTLAEVKASQARYMKRMSEEIQGYRVETCFGAGGCPNRIQDTSALLERIEALLRSEDLLGMLKKRVGENLKFHHEFRVAVADCPNACSQPQIKDVGIISAVRPKISEAPCSLCRACEQVCREGAVRLEDEGPRIDMGLCLECGHCMAACPTETLVRGQAGFRVILGGKLGRHPRLARPLPGRYGEDEVMQILSDCIGLWKDRSPHGERFAELLTEDDFRALCRRYPLKKD